MIAKKQGAPFVVELKPSKKLQRLIIVIHLIAMGASVVNSLTIAVKLAIAAVVGLNFKINYPQLKIEQRKIRYTEKLGWEISDGGDFEAVAILKSTVVTTVFIFLQMHNKSTILIANDALSEDDYRQLIVKLKMTVH